jgi:hypothetical protein
MWVTPDESRADIAGLYQRAWRHSDATIAALPLDAPGQVPWWGDDGTVTLQHVLVHVTAETQRHAGHADILRPGGATTGIRWNRQPVAPLPGIDVSARDRFFLRNDPIGRWIKGHRARFAGIRLGAWRLPPPENRHFERKTMTDDSPISKWRTAGQQHPRAPDPPPGPDPPRRSR